jgi:hypothetical protein
MDILELVPQDQVGGTGKFDGKKLADMFIENFGRETGQGWEPPVIIGHLEDSSPPIGWVTGLRKVGTRLRASLRILTEAVPIARLYRFVSPGFKRFFDQQGVERGSKLSHLAFTPVPFQKGADGKPVGAFQLSEVDADPEAPQEIDSMTIDKDQIKALVAEETKPVLAQLSEATTKMTEATAKLAESDAKVAALGDALKRSDETIASLSEALTARDVDSTIKRGIEKGKLTLAQVPKWGTAEWSPTAWLSDSAFNGLAGLIKHVDTAPPVVDLGPRKSAGTGSQTVQLSDHREEPKVRAERLGMTEAELTRMDQALDAVNR